MNYSNTVVMRHACSKKLRGFTFLKKKNFLCTYIMSKILRKIGKKRELLEKKKS